MCLVIIEDAYLFSIQDGDVYQDDPGQTNNAEEDAEMSEMPAGGK